jgi:hypothetical protein
MRERWNTLPADARLALRLFAIATVILILAFGGLRLYQSRLPAPRRVTMDGGGEVLTINLWDNHQTRGVVTGRAGTGEAADLIHQSGAGCFVKTSSGQQGWVTCANFIKEFQ